MATYSRKRTDREDDRERGGAPGYYGRDREYGQMPEYPAREHYQGSPPQGAPSMHAPQSMAGPGYDDMDRRGYRGDFRGDYRDPHYSSSMMPPVAHQYYPSDRGYPPPPSHRMHSDYYDSRYQGRMGESPPSYAPYGYPAGPPMRGGMRPAPRYRSDLCFDYQKGKCDRVNCRFVHQREQCKDFLRGDCQRGDRCRFDHGSQPQACRDFRQGRCHRGSSCRYSHDEPPSSSHYDGGEHGGSQGYDGQQYESDGRDGQYDSHHEGDRHYEDELASTAPSSSSSSSSSSASEPGPGEAAGEDGEQRTEEQYSAAASREDEHEQSDTKRRRTDGEIEQAAATLPPGPSEA